jgi:hypothetical protein
MDEVILDLSSDSTQSFQNAFGEMNRYDEEL